MLISIAAIGMSNNTLESWSVSEKNNFKDCVRLGGINKDLVKLAVPRRTPQEIQKVFSHLQNKISVIFKSHSLSALQNPKELQFILGCLWDLTSNNKSLQNKLCPTISKDIEVQLVQLLLRYRKDNNTTANAPIPKTLNIQLTPKNQYTESIMNQFGYKSKLQLSVGRTKKVSSIITHLDKKWTVALSSGDFIRLSPMHSDMDLSWIKSDKKTNVSHLYTMLNCTNALVQLEYQFVTESNQQLSFEPIYDNICFTPSMESNFVKLLDGIEPNSSSEVHFSPPSSLKNEKKENESNPVNADCLFQDVGATETKDSANNLLAKDSECTNDNLFTTTLQDDLHLPNPLPIIDSACTNDSIDEFPVTPFKPQTTIDDTSCDGFSPMTRGRKYEGKCRDYWFQLEQSVDYSSFYTNKKRKRNNSNDSEEPCTKKRALSHS